MIIRTPVTVAITTLPSKLTPPEPPIVTIATTPSLFAYSLHVPLPELAHRHAQPCDLGSNDRLIAAVVRALSMITTARRTRLLNAYPVYSDYLAALSALPADCKANLEPPLLPLTIRTDSAPLIEAALYLRDETAKIDDETNPLKKQLQRFDVRWMLLPPGAEELKALARWAEIECRAGVCVSRGEETRRDAARSNYEPQHGGIDSEAVQDEASEASGKDEADEAA